MDKERCCGHCNLWDLHKAPQDDKSEQDRVGHCMARLPLPEWAVIKLYLDNGNITKFTEGRSCHLFIKKNGGLHEPQHQ